MTRKKDVDLSLGLGQSQPSPSDQLMQEQMASQLAVQDAMVSNPIPEVPQKETTYTIFKLVNTQRKGRLNIDGIDDAINPKTNKVERIRLLSGVDTIWVKEQKDISDEYVRQNRRSLVFEGKFCRIPNWDHTALEFARLCRSFIESPAYRTKGSRHAFFEWNPARQAEEAAKKNQLKMKCMRLALEAEEEAMRKHAFYLGIKPVDEYGITKNSEAIRNEYFEFAGNNPGLFEQSYGNPRVTVAFLVKKAISDGKIDLTREPGSAYWAMNGGFICGIPLSKVAHEHLIDIALSGTKEGKTFLETLQSIST